MRNFILAAVFLILVVNSYGQTPSRVVHHREQAWFAYFNQTRFSNKWGMWLDVHYRMTDNFVDRPFQLLIRPGVTYYIKDNLRATVGYALVEHYPAKGLHTTRTEHRAWQQIMWNQKYPRLATTQWLRLEERNVEKTVNDVKTGGYNFTWRTRYNFAFYVPLKGKEMTPKTPYAMLQNEVFLSFGRNVVYNTFDQNRFFVGLGYQFSSRAHVNVGYLNVFSQNASGNEYFSSNNIRVWFFHSFDLRKS